MVADFQGRLSLVRIFKRILQNVFYQISLASSHVIANGAFDSFTVDRPYNTTFVMHIGTDREHKSCDVLNVNLPYMSLSFSVLPLLKIVM